MNKKIVFIGSSVELPNLVNVDYDLYHLYKLKPATWIKKLANVVTLIEEGKVDGIIIYMPTSFLLQASEDSYSKIFLEFLSKRSSIKTLIIAYEQNLYGNFNFYDYVLEEYITKEELLKRILIGVREESQPDEDINEGNLMDYVYKYYYDYETAKLILSLKRIDDFESRKDQVKKFLEILLDSDIPIVPFINKLDIRIRVQAFVFEITKTIFFSIFVKKEQPLHEEFESFVKLFEKYIKNVEGVSMTIETESFENGISFNFKSSDNSVDFDQFHQAIERFGHFMELCQNDLESAVSIVNKRIKDTSIALNLINDLLKKYRRLLLDVQHQKERILLTARQDLESSLGEIQEKSLMLKMSGIESVSYPIIDSRDLGNTLLLKDSYSEEEQNILNLIKNNFDLKEYLQSKSDLDKIKTEQVPIDIKRDSMLKIKGRLVKLVKKVASHTEDIGVKVLTAYLENMVK